jgi:hypothetical protein
MSEAKRLSNLLIRLRACSGARTWARGKSLHEAWNACERPDWLFWLAGRMAGKPGWPTRQQIVLAACACAETALRFVRQGEDRPRLAIEAARAWTRGEANIEEVRLAAADAAAAYAAYVDAAYAAYAAGAAYAARGEVPAQCVALIRRELGEPLLQEPAQ